MGESAEKAVLIVDDEVIILSLIDMSIRKRYGSGLRCLRATNGLRALEVLGESIRKGQSVVAALSDWQMPRMLGDEFLGILRKEHPEIMRVMISGQVAADKESSMIEALGLAGFLPKPLVLDELYRLLDRVAAPESA